MSKSLKVSTPDPAKRVVIIDDHPTFRQGLAQVILNEPDLALCGSAGTAAQALKLIKNVQPDLVLLDITLPDKNGLELIKEIRNISEHSKILVVSMHDEALYANRVLALGGDGYIMKQEDPDEIVYAIRDVLNGHIYLSEKVLGEPGAGKRKIVAQREQPLDRLTDSELEILELLGLGKSEQEIGRKLKLTSAQIEVAFSAMRKKLRARHQNGLIRYAVSWVEAGKL